MLRSFLPLPLLLASFFLAACTAKVDEKCVGGSCDLDGLPDTFKPPPMDASMDTGGLVDCAAPAGGPAGDVPCEVFEVIHRKCHMCHVNPTVNGAPFPILSYEDVLVAPDGYPPGSVVFKLMNRAIRPGAPIRMPLGSMLDDNDQKVLGDWLNLCAPPTPDGMGCQCPAPGMGCN